MPAPESRRTNGAVSGGLVVLAVVLISVNLRPGVSSVGPILAEIRDDLDMAATTAGALTGIPGLCFALAGMLAVSLGRRVGVTTGIALGLAAAAAGLLLRVVVDDVWLFLLLTVLALAGMAVGNILVPAWIKSHRREVLMMTIYGTGINVGGAIGALATAPVVSATGSWRQGLGVWGVTALVSLPLWFWLGRRERLRTSEHEVAGVRPDGRIAHSPTAIALTVLFGLQSMHAYVQFGWLPQIYRDAGMSATAAGGMVALLMGTSVIGGLIMPSVVDRASRLRVWMLAFGVLLVLGYTGLLLAPATVPWLWALLLGVAGFYFPAAIALITARTQHPAITGELSGFVQSIGYLLAAIGPFVVGLIHDLTGGWNEVLLLLMATAVPLMIAAVRVSARTYVDDELVRRGARAGGR